MVHSHWAWLLLRHCYDAAGVSVSNVLLRFNFFAISSPCLLHLISSHSLIFPPTCFDGTLGPSTTRGEFVFLLLIPIYQLPFLLSLFKLFCGLNVIGKQDTGCHYMIID